MNIKKIANSILLFTINRLVEILGFAVLSIGIFFLIALISYSPDDPNFIFPENTVIKNLLGFQGSYISDLLFQSVGLISYLISFTFIFTGINIFRSKDLFLVIENIFFMILYCIFGSLFFSFFYEKAYMLHINGNGGFIGNYLNESFIHNLINLNTFITYYFLIFLIIGLFLISINFRPKKFWNYFKKIINFI